MSALFKATKDVVGFVKRGLIGGGKKKEDKLEDGDVSEYQIGGAATEEELEAQRRKREQIKRRGVSRGIGERPRGFGTILSGGRKFGG